MQECITKGDQSVGYREFCGMAPGVTLLPDAAGYRLYIEGIFDELSTEVKVLFDRGDAASVLWPRRQTFETLIEILNDVGLSPVWVEDETIGWVYQYFNSSEERRAMRDVSQAPRNSRELAVRNQFLNGHRKSWYAWYTMGISCPTRSCLFSRNARVTMPPAILVNESEPRWTPKIDI